MISIEQSHGRLAGRLYALNAKLSSIQCGSAGSERDAVHADAVKGRLVAFRVYIFAQHGASALRHRQGLDGQAHEVLTNQAAGGGGIQFSHEV